MATKTEAETLTRSETHFREHHGGLTVLGMLTLMTFNLVSSVTAVLLAALAMGLTGCLTMKDAYRSISWESLVLIAGMLPMAVALEKTGGLDLIVVNIAGGLRLRVKC